MVVGEYHRISRTHSLITLNPNYSIWLLFEDGSLLSNATVNGLTFKWGKPMCMVTSQNYCAILRRINCVLRILSLTACHSKMLQKVMKFSIIKRRIAAKWS